MIKPEEMLSFATHDWKVLKMWLLEQREQKVGLLIGASTQEQSDKYRGSIAMISQILALESAAQVAAQRK